MKEMIDRRFFLKLTGLVAAASALDTLTVAAQGRPDGAQPALSAHPVQRSGTRAPGTYQFTGRVRLVEPLVDISGITNAQQITWSQMGAPVAGFTSFEHFDQPWTMPDIRVRGGQLETLAVVPLELA
jgi:hypothetical protein